MHHIALHLTHYIILLVAYLYSYTLDYVEPELEVQAEQAQAEDLTNCNIPPGLIGLIAYLYH
jgi:hypothetical protein